MADKRNRRAKLQAIIDSESGATDGERANARTLLERLEEQRQRPPPEVRPFQEFARSRLDLERAIDELWKRAQRPGFSNGNRRASRPVVDVPDRTQRNGAVVGTLQFGDVLGPGSTPKKKIHDQPAIALGPGRPPRFDRPE